MKLMKIYGLKRNHYKNLKIVFLKEAKNCDLVILADFGHGLFSNDLITFINKFKKKDKFINVQTNSANLGFNFYNKYSHYAYLSIDERELRLALSEKSIFR